MEDGLEEKRRLADEVILRLKKEYPDTHCTLDYAHAWQLLVSLRLAAQLSFAEIAQIMEISPKAATERYRRLIGRCRKLTEGLSMSDF